MIKTKNSFKLVFGILVVAVFVSLSTTVVYGTIDDPLPPPITNCNDYDEPNCPIGAACEFNNEAEGTVEPGHCEAAFGSCFCVPDAEPPPPPPPLPPNEVVDCSTLGTPAACNGGCDFVNIEEDVYAGHCAWLGDPATGGCDCIPDDPEDMPPPDPCDGVICSDCETCVEGACQSNCVAGKVCNAGVCELPDPCNECEDDPSFGGPGYCCGTCSIGCPENPCGEYPNCNEAQDCPINGDPTAGICVTTGTSDPELFEPSCDCFPKQSTCENSIPGQCGGTCPNADEQCVPVGDAGICECILFEGRDDPPTLPEPPPYDPGDNPFEDDPFGGTSPEVPLSPASDDPFDID